MSESGEEIRVGPGRRRWLSVTPPGGVTGPYRLRSEQWLPQDRESLLPFFADIRNLQKLTPPHMDFQVLTPWPFDMHEGLIVDLKVTVRGVALRWRTRITKWDPPRSFADDQLKGPYWRGEHEHRFVPTEGGTAVVDTVLYSPMGGRLVHALFVGRDVRKVFEYRHEKLAELFDPAVDSGASAGEEATP